MKKNKLIAALAFVFIISLSFCIFAFPANAVAINYAYELLQCENAYLETNAVVPASTGIADGRRGILVSGGNGGKVTFYSALSGETDLEFMPYSSASFGGATFEQDSYDNSYADINEMSLTFTDTDNGNAFSVKLTAGAKGNNVTVSASVVYNDKQVGICYFQDSGEIGNTTGGNANGVYTWLFGSSFSNMAVNGGNYSAKNVKPVRIVFDPYQMKVFGYNYGYNAYSAEKRLIWDFSKQINDGFDGGFTLDGFDNYTLSISFDSVKVGKRANIILYSFNGQSLADTVLNKKVGANCYVSALEQGKVGTKFQIAKPVCFDVMDGNVDFQGTVKIVSEQGNAAISAQTALVANSDGSYNYVDGMYFTPTCAGKHTLTYRYGKDGIWGNEYSFEFYVAESTSGIVANVTQSVFSIGDNLIIPTATFNGLQQSVSVKVFKPNGAEMLSPYKADTEGRYTVKYSYNDNGIEYQTEVFLYALNSDGILFTAGNGVEMKSGNSSLTQNLNGLVVSNSINNAVVYYQNEIDLTDKTENDILIELSADASVWGQRDFRQLTVRLTDVNDENNYVTIVCYASDNEVDQSVVRAAANGQTLSGLNASGTIQSYVGGGTPILHSFSGEARYKPIEQHSFALSINYQQRQIFANGKLVCDLDDNAHFTTAWEGFSSGKVKMSVLAQEMESDGCKYIVRQVDGKQLQNGFYRDCVAPVINLGVTEIPFAQTGKEYPILPAEVKDNIDANPMCSVQVLDANGNAVAVDNKFIPTQMGSYAIIYTATDFSGNMSQCRVNVAVFDMLPTLTVVLPDVITECYAGESITLPQPNISGGSGNAKIEITAKGQTSGNVAEVQNGVFRALIEDVYTVEFVATDHIGNVTKASCQIAVNMSKAPLFLDEIVLPEVFISGREYNLPLVTAYDFYAVAGKSTVVTTECSVLIDGVRHNVSNGSFVPQTQSDKTVAVVTYSAKSSAADGQTGVFTKEIPLVSLKDDKDVIYIERYFMVDGFQVEKTNSYIDFTTQQSGASFKFIKEVYSDGFDINFDVPGTANNVDRVFVTLQDYADKTKTVVFEIIKAGSSDNFSYLSINGEERVTIVGNFFDSVQHLCVHYDNKNYSVKDSTGLTVGYVKTYADGSPFRGFSDNVLFSVKAGNVNGLATVRLYRVGNQAMSARVREDVIAPVIILSADMSRTATLGQTVEIPAAQAHDILGFSSTIKVSVRKGTEIILKETNADVSHSFAASDYGEYYVTYTAEDDNKNSSSYTLAVTVRDNVPPVIDVDTKERVVNVGDKVTINKASVSDNMAGDIVLKVYLIDTSNYMRDITNQQQITVESSGIYTVRYFAMDSFGNSTIVDVLIKVNGEQQ